MRRHETARPVETGPPIALTVLVAGPARFCEPEAAVPGVSGRMMTEPLQELEHAGLVRHGRPQPADHEP